MNTSARQELRNTHSEKIPPWKTVHRNWSLYSVLQYEHALQKQNFHIGGNALLALNAYLVKKERFLETDSIPFTRKSVRALTGNSKAVNTERVYDAIKQCGGSLCAPLDAFHLRLGYADQPLGESLLIAMPTISIRDTEIVFSVSHDEGGRSIDARDSDFLLHKLWNADSEWVYLAKC